MTTTEVREHPILFQGDMIRAILDGRKTQTRRVVKPQPGVDDCTQRITEHADGLWQAEATNQKWRCPYGVPGCGDRLWVREAWAMEPDAHPSEAGVLYRATDPGWDDNDTGLRWKPSIHMPRWASRITLEVLSVRVQRVQEIREEDAEQEGVGAESDDGSLNCSHWVGFKQLWDTINAKRGFGWDANPWVWAVEFKETTR